MKKEEINIYNSYKNRMCLSIIIFLLVSIVSTFSMNTKYAYAGTKETKRNEWYNPKPNCWYYYNEDGELATGLYEVEELRNTYYFSTGFANLGLMQTGWRQIGNDTYYFNESDSEGSLGARHTGWLRKNKTAAGYDWYYLDKDGKLITGLYKVEGGKETYYFSTSFTELGRMKTGWQKINDKIYYFNENITEGSLGSKHIGWLKKQKIHGSGDDWYYFNENGDIVTGWYEKGPSTKYYFSDSFTEYGVMKTGVVTINGIRYYFKSDGILACNTTIDGYKTDINGRII